MGNRNRFNNNEPGQEVKEEEFTAMEAPTTETPEVTETPVEQVVDIPQPVVEEKPVVEPKVEKVEAPIPAPTPVPVKPASSKKDNTIISKGTARG